MSSDSEEQLNTGETALLINKRGESFPLQSPCEIGRVEPCYLVIDDSQISRKHCLLQKDSTELWWITDLGSTNGTYINNRRISKATQLSHGDKIILGNHTFTFSDIRDNKGDTPEKADPDVAGTNILFTQTQCWLLVADIIGSTAMSQRLSPEDLNLVISEWRNLCEDIIHRHKGEINQYLGDGFFAYWNAQDTDGNTIMAAIKKLKDVRPTQALDFRIILNYGLVQLGGPLSKGEENLCGSAVYYLFKAEKVAGSLGEYIFITDNAADNMDHTFLRKIGSYPVPGFPGESDFYTLKD